MCIVLDAHLPPLREITLKRTQLNPEAATTERLNRAIVGLQLIQRTNDPDSSVVTSVNKALAPLMKELANRQRAAAAAPAQSPAPAPNPPTEGSPSKAHRSRKP
jgi:hypothetical protein